MGYFSNGSEGMDYQAAWCDRCVHGESDEGLYCPVWAMHLDWNSDQCRHGWDTTTDPAVIADSKAKDAALQYMIPRIGIWNGGCRMFIATDPEWRGREDELRSLWDGRAREREDEWAKKHPQQPAEKETNG